MVTAGDKYCGRMITKRLAMMLILVMMGSGCATSGLSEGISLMKQRDLDGAITAFSRALETDPENPELYFHRANARGMKIELAAAFEDYNRAIELDPEHADAYTGRGVVRVQQGDIDEGLKDLSRAIDIDPGYGKALMLRAMLYKQQGHLDGALSDLSRALHTNPEAEADILFQRGLIYAEQGELNRALSDFDRILGKDSRSIHAYIERAAIRLQQKRYQEAIKDCNLALRIFPLAVRAIKIRGDALLAQGDYDLAIWNYSNALDIDAQADLIYQSRGRAYMKSGRIAEACADFERACRKIDCSQEDFNDWRRRHCQ